MRDSRTARRCIWCALAVQVAGLAYDAAWHGVIHSGAEPATRREMALHLLTVHLPLYVGVAAVLVTTLWAFFEALVQRRAGGGWWLAMAGAVLSTVGEAWHAVMHLRLDTHAGALAGSLSPIGLILVAGAVWRAGRRRYGRAADGGQRRAA